MSKLSEFYASLTQVRRPNAAVDTDGMRTVHGILDARDVPILAQRYPNVGAEAIKEIATCIGSPRLLEVVSVVESLERWLTGSFSTLPGIDFHVVNAPLQLFLSSPINGQIQRIYATETELRHGAIEHLKMRDGAMQLINELLHRRYELTLTSGCNCTDCLLPTDDLKRWFGSDYYEGRERIGRQNDSDMPHVTVFEGISVAEIPVEVLEATVDFGSAEVASYLRFAEACHAVVEGNRVFPDTEAAANRARAFLAQGTIATA